ncbi:inositol 2-dehydrogenase [Oceanibium sediminis]|uniref:inositol 2-dehydrogenase n=1 Tax=Oceanibium sediminis TaxID=2026339 RepID=UPI000DD36831|nr:inositol 2-dehydrogenase [Oceanibium sediminis]
MIRIALLGCGRIGQVHARTLKALDAAQVTAVSDFLPEAAQRLAATLGAEARETAAIIASDDVDAVVIGTPTDTHYDLIHAAAKAGKAIFCEKPVDLSSDRIGDCIRAVEQAGVPFMTAFNRRFDPSFATLQGRIAAGDIGDVELVTILSRDPSPPPAEYIKSSGGIFRDMMIHDFDMARFLLGEEPVEVHAMGSVLVDPAIGEAGDVDTAAVMLRTASGKICQISNSRRATYGYDQRIEVHGSKGLLRAENKLENTVELATEAGFARAPALNFFLERYEDAYRREMEHFITALSKGTPVSPSITDGLKAQLLADAASTSLQSGKPVAL